MKELLQKLLEARQLERAEAGRLMQGFAGGELNEAQMALVLSAFMMRHLSTDELLGFNDALMELAVKPELGTKALMDMCGTGGDGKHTFNISTLSAIVAAASGVPVAKHGNYGASSMSGSSNVLEQLGYKFSNSGEKLRRELEQANMCFLHAPLFHPALKAVGPVRRQLGLRSFFNVLGPLVNPVEPHYQVSGVFNLETARLYTYFLQSKNRCFRVVHALDGYDEVSLTGAVKVFTPRGESLLRAESFGLPAVLPHELHGGESLEDAALIFKNVLENEATPAQKHAVAANAALAIHCYGLAASLPEAVELAKESLASGRALQSFKKLIEIQS